jgi:tripartite-type tricarboxylate transporter receptor subunit TctC
MKLWKVLLTAALAVIALATPAIASDDYPSRPITLIVPFSAGGNSDTSSRLIARLLSEKLGQTVVVDNKPGAGGILGMEIGAVAKPDGYTLIFSSSGQMATYPHLYKKLSFDPVKSFVPIRAGASNPYLMLFNPSKPYKTLPEFIAHAKKHENSINYGSVGNGSAGHLAGELLQQLTGIKMTHIAYKLSPNLYADLLSGVLDIGFEFPNSMRANIEAGKVIPIAIASEERMKSFPNIPTFAELGYPDMKIAAWGVFLAPAGTPAPIIRKLDTAIGDILKSPTMTEYYRIGDSNLLDIGHDKFPDFLARESAQMKALVERSGATVD